MASWIKTLAIAVAVVIAPVLPVSLAQAPTAVPAKPADVKPADQMANGISLSGAWARATPGGARIGAAFLEISAAAGIEDKLIGASSPIAQSVELHDHIRDGGIVKMRRIDVIPIATGKNVTLKPGGLHLMLMDLKAGLKEGDEFDIILTFEKAGAIKIRVPIQKIGAMSGPPAGSAPGMQHDHGSGSGAGTK